MNVNICDVQTVTPKLGTVFPGTSAKLILIGVQVWGGAYRGLPTVFVQLVISLWRSFIHEEISEWNVNKSGNRPYIYAPKVE